MTPQLTEVPVIQDSPVPEMGLPPREAVPTRRSILESMKPGQWFRTLGPDNANRWRVAGNALGKGRYSVKIERNPPEEFKDQHPHIVLCLPSPPSGSEAGHGADCRSNDADFDETTVRSETRRPSQVRSTRIVNPFLTRLRTLLVGEVTTTKVENEARVRSAIHTEYAVSQRRYSVDVNPLNRSRLVITRLEDRPRTPRKSPKGDLLMRQTLKGTLKGGL